MKEKHENGITCFLAVEFFFRDDRKTVGGWVAMHYFGLGFQFYGRWDKDIWLPANLYNNKSIARSPRKRGGPMTEIF